MEKFAGAMSQALGGGAIASGASLYFSCKAETMIIALGVPSGQARWPRWPRLVR